VGEEPGFNNILHPGKNIRQQRGLNRADLRQEGLKHPGTMGSLRDEQLYPLLTYSKTRHMLV